MISLWKPERPVSVVKVLPYFLDNLSDIINYTKWAHVILKVFCSKH